MVVDNEDSFITMSPSRIEALLVTPKIQSQMKKLNHGMKEAVAVVTTLPPPLLYQSRTELRKYFISSIKCCRT